MKKETYYFFFLSYYFPSICLELVQSIFFSQCHNNLREMQAGSKLPVDRSSATKNIPYPLHSKLA